MSKNAKRVAAFLLAAVLLASCLTACGGGIESKLPGVYDNGFHQLTIYSDGTYKEELEYGTGTWTVLDGNVLKLTGFYGDTMTYNIKDVTSEGILLETGSLWERIK